MTSFPGTSIGHVLAGVERHLVVEVDHEPAGLPGDVLERDQGAGEVLHRVVDHTLLEIDVGLDRDVGFRGGDAGQRLALVALELHQGEVRGVVVLDVAVEHLHLAGAAGAVRAGVREPHPGTQAGVEDRLVGPALDLPPSGSTVTVNVSLMCCPLRQAGRERLAGREPWLPGRWWSAGPGSGPEGEQSLVPDAGVVQRTAVGRAEVLAVELPARRAPMGRSRDPRPPTGRSSGT